MIQVIGRFPFEQATDAANSCDQIRDTAIATLAVPDTAVFPLPQVLMLWKHRAFIPNDVGRFKNFKLLIDVAEIWKVLFF